MTIIEIRLDRRNLRSQAYRKLSVAARELLELMREVYKKHGTEVFNTNSLRGHGWNWRQLADLFYELESRNFGQVQSDGPQLEFLAYPPVLQD